MRAVYILIAVACTAHVAALDREVEVDSAGLAYHSPGAVEQNVSAQTEIGVLLAACFVCALAVRGSRDTSRKVQTTHVLPAQPVDPAVAKRTNAAILRCATVDDILGLAAEHGPTMNGVNVSTCVYRVAKTVKMSRCVSGHRASARDVTRQPGWSNLMDLTRSRISELKPQSLSNILWAFATLSWSPRDGLLDEICDSAMQQIESFNPQDLANTAGALASLKCRKDSFMQAIAEQALMKLDSFVPQAVSTVAWACGTLGYRHVALMQAIGDAVKDSGDTYTAQDLVNCIWAMATLGTPHVAALATASDILPSRFSKCSPQHIAHIAWAYATLGCANKVFFWDLAEACIPRLASFSHNILAGVTSSFAKAGIGHEGLFAAVVQVIQGSLRSCNPNALASLAWSCSVQRTQEAFVVAALNSAASRASALSVDGLLQLAATLPLATHVPGPVVEQVALAAAERRRELGVRWEEVEAALAPFA
mmetsp:Transcript_52895/g.116101  ORF Transcript_52895/g.116101 Transcript_52895/m.116101 type:complete len:479 (-) Transcript_52895:205-1641(-)